MISPRFATRGLGVLAGVITLSLVAACGSDTPTSDNPPAAEASDNTSGDNTSSDNTSSDAAGTQVTLVTYDSFPVEGPANDALAAFTADTGIDIELLLAGDTGTMLTKAGLTAGDPEGDVLWGVDNTFLTRAIDEEVFEPYRSPGLDVVADDLVALVPDDLVTPVDFGDVCINYDGAWFAERDLAPPSTFTDLIDPAYADLLVVQNPATSSPGLAFVLATIASQGEDGWQDYWAALRDNGVMVTDGWTEAYYEVFSWAGGDRPLVVSYSSSPPFEVVFATEPIDEATTGVVESTCFRQVEFAGVLRGTDNPDGARRLIDFLISDRFQRELPLNLFVFPANENVELDPVFTDFAVIPDEPLTVDPAAIDTNRSQWIDEWTEIVLG